MGIETTRPFTAARLEEMNLGQLHVLVNDLHYRIEGTPISWSTRGDSLSSEQRRTGPPSDRSRLVEYGAGLDPGGHRRLEEVRQRTFSRLISLTSFLVDACRNERPSHQRRRRRHPACTSFNVEKTLSYGLFCARQCSFDDVFATRPPPRIRLGQRTSSSAIFFSFLFRSSDAADEHQQIESNVKKVILRTRLDHFT